METKNYMAIFSRSNVRINRYFGHDSRRLIATVKNKMPLQRLASAWIELYELQGNTAVKLSKWVYKRGTWELVWTQGFTDTRAVTGLLSAYMVQVLKELNPTVHSVLDTLDLETTN